MQKSKIFFSRDYWICIQLIISHKKYILSKIHTFHKNVRWPSGLRRDEAGGVCEGSQVRIPVGTQIFFYSIFCTKNCFDEKSKSGKFFLKFFEIFFDKFDSTSL